MDADHLSEGWIEGVLRMSERLGDRLGLILGAIWAHIDSINDPISTINYNQQRHSKVGFNCGGMQ